MNTALDVQYASHTEAALEHRDMLLLLLASFDLCSEVCSSGVGVVASDREWDDAGTAQLTNMQGNKDPRQARCLMIKLESDLNRPRNILTRREVQVGLKSAGPPTVR